MASTQEAEIIFAQKLASNEKPIRSKALLKLRKYISARSGRDEGGFGEDELLKIWKGLFYCMWMQDKPLVQEELSTKISRLLHSFQTVDSQLLYFKAFLQTMKREWNGIDRLRMDKFYQLVRFVFREMFEMLKRQNWESSVVNQFLQLFSAQLLQNSSAAPAGLSLHVFELYTSELARVGSAQLTAEQNLTFIEPFCKAMAKTKDRVLLKAIGSNVFSTIVDQVPFAIEDLLREIRQGDGEELDASGGSEDQQDNEELKTKSRSKKTQDPTEAAQDNECEEDCDEDNCSLPDDMDSEDDGHGPVLQFDYGAIADRLFEQASYSNIPSFNRSKIYKFVKIFRDLSEGVFPQDEVEDVSTDEDEDEDDNRRRKRKKQTIKGQKEQASLKRSKGQSEASADTSEDNKQKTKKGKKKKRKSRSLKSVDGETDQQTDAQTPVESSNPSEIRRETQDAENNADLSERDGVNKPDKQANGLGLKLLKKIRRKMTSEDTSEGAADGSETGIGSTSAEIVTSAPLKKKKKQMINVKDVGGGETERDGPAEVNSVSTLTCSISASVEEPPAVTPSKRRSTAKNAKVQADSQETASSKASRKTLMKKKKQKDGVVDVPEPYTNGEAHQEAESVHAEDSQTESRQPDGCTDATAGSMRVKKRKQKSAASADQIKPKIVKMNGHAGKKSVKRPKAISAEEASLPVNTGNKIDPKQFVLCQKTAPAAIFCKAAAHNTRKLSKKILLPSKPETKKVRFGLKNNKTMEISSHSRVSPASQSRVAFDPKRTPKSGVLKSPTSSPAVTRRAMAADFF